jgi:hypothetical protein
MAAGTAFSNIYILFYKIYFPIADRIPAKCSKKFLSCLQRLAAAVYTIYLKWNFPQFRAGNPKRRYKG